MRKRIDLVARTKEEVNGSIIFMEYPPTKIEQTINMAPTTDALILRGELVITIPIIIEVILKTEEVSTLPRLPITNNTHAIGSNLSPCFLIRSFIPIKPTTNSQTITIVNTGGWF